MKANLEIIARILGFSTVFGVLLVLIWLGLYSTGFLCSFQMFGLTQHECGVMTYGGIGLMKLVIYTFFLVPWIAIKLEIRRQSRNR
jgi:bacteriorhodopsin